ncbi:YdgA family protein [Conservatibacter flavescens]|nr:YdgA family protein [Conservatibacter flavescens]
MKKSTLALSVIVVLGAVWSGGAWYTGKKAEAEYQTYLAQVNEQLKPYEIQIENATFERGVFSSDVSYSLIFDDTAIPFVGKLYHGPLPLNHLASFDFSPAVFSKVMDVAKNENTQKWFDYAQGKVPLNSDTTVSYSGNTKVKLTFNPAKIEEDNAVLAWDKGSLTYELDGTQKYLDWDLNQLSLKLQNVDWNMDAELKAVDLGFNQFKAKLQWQDTPYQYIKLGQLNGTADEYWLNYETDQYQDKSTYKDWKFDYRVSEKDGLLALKMDDNAHNMAFDALVKSLVHFQHIDMAALNTLITAATLMDENGHNPMEAEAEAATQKLLQNQPHFVIKMDLDNKENASAKLNFDLQIGDMAQVEKQPLSIFKHLDINIESDKNILERLVTKMMMQFGNMPQEQARQLYVEGSEDVLKGLVSQSIVQDKGNQLALNVQVKENKLQINDRTLSDSELQMMLFVLMMSLGSMGN